MRIVCFEDDATAQLAPVVTARPAYAISCASTRLVDWLRRFDAPLSAAVRPHLRVLQREDFGVQAIDADPWPDQQAVLLVNARLVPCKATFDGLRQLISGGSEGAVSQGPTLAAALVPAGHRRPDPVATPGGDGQTAAAGIAEADVSGLQTLLAAARQLTPVDLPLTLFQWPHDVVAWHMRLMRENMELRIAEGGYTQTQDGVFLAEGATIGQHAVIDTREGPILLDKNVRVGPFCYLSGPVYAGPGTRVIEHAALKDGVALGHTVKIGGEVEASVIEPYTNKQHHGFLGHSYLGSWINLGAGTCNSDLKNTYGPINVQYNGQRVATGMQFMGCVIGDYAKTAINTGIFTGKVVGVCSMLYGFVTSNVPSFVNYARLFGQVAELPPDVMISTQQRMFARRNVTQRACDKQLILDMFHLTAAERAQDVELAAF